MIIITLTSFHVLFLQRIQMLNERQILLKSGSSFVAIVIRNIRTPEKQGCVFQVAQTMLSHSALEWVEGRSRRFSVGLVQQRSRKDQIWKVVGFPETLRASMHSQTVNAKEIRRWYFQCLLSKNFGMFDDKKYTCLLTKNIIEEQEYKKHFLSYSFQINLNYIFSILCHIVPVITGIVIPMGSSTLEEI